jgi:two-component system, LytTR family, response regulator LytT
MGGMALLRIAVCDDEKKEHELLKEYLPRLMKSTAYSFEIQYFTCGEELLHYYNQQSSYPFHILLMDIELRGLNGIEVAKKIRALPDREVQIIFLTNYPQYVMNSFDVQPFHYLIKPVDYEYFEAKIIKLCNYIISSVNRFLMIKTEDGHMVIKNSDVIAIVKIKHSLAKNRLKIITSTQHYIISGTILEYISKLNRPFMLIHRSVIVNLEHVHKFTATSVVMHNQEQFPIGRTQAKEVKEAYAYYMIAQFKERG